MKKNAEIICIHCMHKRKADWQKRNRDLKIKAGDSVKLEFPDGIGTAEHMWVLINKIKGRTFYGILCNKPYYLREYKYGQGILFSRKDIEDWKKG